MHWLALTSTVMLLLAHVRNWLTAHWARETIFEGSTAILPTNYEYVL